MASPEQHKQHEAVPVISGASASAISPAPCQPGIPFETSSGISPVCAQTSYTKLISFSSVDFVTAEGGSIQQSRMVASSSSLPFAACQQAPSLSSLRAASCSSWPLEGRSSQQKAMDSTAVGKQGMLDVVSSPSVTQASSPSATPGNSSNCNMTVKSTSCLLIPVFSDEKISPLVSAVLSRTDETSGEVFSSDLSRSVENSQEISSDDGYLVDPQSTLEISRWFSPEGWPVDPSGSSAHGDGPSAVEPQPSTSRGVASLRGPHRSAQSQEPSPFCTDEYILWHIVRAAKVLKSTLEQLDSYQRANASLRRHMNRCAGAVMLLQKTSYYATHVGTTAKVVGGLVSLAGMVSQNGLLKVVGGRLWKSGCVVKFAALAVKLLSNIWNNGFQSALSAHNACLARLTESLNSIHAVLEDLQLIDASAFVLDRLMPMLLLVCPEDLFSYTCHIVRLLISPEHYSALNDFVTMAISTFPPTASLPVHILHQVESYRVFDCLSDLPQPLQFASVAAHIAKELYDLFSGLSTVNSEDFLVIRNLLQRLRASSTTLLESIRRIPLLSGSQSVGDTEATERMRSVEVPQLMLPDIPAQAEVSAAQISREELIMVQCEALDTTVSSPSEADGHAGMSCESTSAQPDEVLSAEAVKPIVPPASAESNGSEENGSEEDIDRMPS